MTCDSKINLYMNGSCNVYSHRTEELKLIVN